MINSTNHGSKVKKRLRSPRKFVASPSNRAAKKNQFSFSREKSRFNNDIDILSYNIFDTPTTPKRNKQPEALNDRFLPSRGETSFRDTLALLSTDTECNNAGPDSVIGVTGIPEVSPATQTSQNSNQSSPALQQAHNFDSLLRDELFGKIQTPQSTQLVEPRTPTKLSQRRLFHYRGSQKTTLEFNSVVSSHTLSPLTAFKAVEKYSEYSNFVYKAKRKINKQPFKILDAPSLKDDYYLNLVDWGSQNVLAVALGSSVYLWNASTTKVSLLTDIAADASTSTDSDDQVTSVSWTVDGNTLAVGTSKGEVQVWDVVEKKLTRILKGHSARVGALSWSSTFLASGSRDKKILRRDLRDSNDICAALIGHKQEVCGLRWSFDGNQLASGGNDNKLLVWDCHSERPLWKFSKSHQAAVKAVAWSPHETGLLASGGGTADRCIKFWNTLTGTNLNSIDTGSQVCNLTWSKSVNEVVSTHGYSLNHMIVWKYPSMSKIITLNGHTSRVLYLAMSPDGQTVVSGAGDERLCFWNLFPSSKSKRSVGRTLLFPETYDIR